MNYRICITCGELKQEQEFRESHKGISKRCLPCLELRNKGIWLPQDAHYEAYSKLILQELGYDIEKPVYEQFKQRVKERYGRDI